MLVHEYGSPSRVASTITERNSLTKTRRCQLSVSGYVGLAPLGRSGGKCMAGAISSVEAIRYCLAAHTGAW